MTQLPTDQRHSLCGLKTIGALTVLGLAVYAHGVSLLGPDARVLLPPFQPNVEHRSLTHLGGENFKIGYRVARGQGFADPYGIGSGPTAWMPPIYPLLCAGLILVFDRDVQTIGFVMAGIQSGVLIVVWVWLVELIRPASRRAAGTLFGAFLLFLLTHFRYSYLFTHDYSLAILATTALLRYVPTGPPPAARRRWAAWGALGGLATLTAPALFAVWGTLTLAQIRGNRSGALWSGLVFLAVLAPWTIRNAVVFGKFIPVKSNAGYELFQSLKYSADGVVTRQTFQEHPGNPGPEMFEYRELGEAKYLSHKTAQAKALVCDSPARYAEQCAFRCWAIFVYEIPFFSADMRTLPKWFSFLVYPLPTLGLLVIVVRRWWRRDPPAGTAALAMISLAIPYILISFYDRYEYTFGPAKIALTYYGVQAAVADWRRPLPPTPCS